MIVEDYDMIMTMIDFGLMIVHSIKSATAIIWCDLIVEIALMTMTTMIIGIEKSGGASYTIW